MKKNILASKYRKHNKQLSDYYNCQKELKLTLDTFKTFSKTIIKEVMNKGWFYQIIPSGIDLIFLPEKYFEGFEKFIDFKELSVYESEITISDLDPNKKESSRLYKMVNQLINIEDRIAELAKEKCSKVYLIRKNNLTLSSVDNPLKRTIHDCKLTEQVIFIGIPYYHKTSLL